MVSSSTWSATFPSCENSSANLSEKDDHQPVRTPGLLAEGVLGLAFNEMTTYIPRIDQIDSKTTEPLKKQQIAMLMVEAESPPKQCDYMAP